MSTKISQLPVATSPVAPSAVLPVVQDGQTKKASIDQLGFLQSGTGVTTRTIQNKLRDTVSVKDFGAVGDGVADDNVAIRTAIQYGITNNVGIYVPSGTYLIKKIVTVALLGTNQNLFVYGDGETSIIKLADGEITTINSRMFIFDVIAGQTANSVFFQDLLIDNNTRGSVGPATTPGDFSYEQAHTMSVRATSATLRRARFINVGIKDPCADGWNCAGTAGGVYQYEIIDCHVRDRTRLRRDIQFSLPPKLAIIRNFRGTGIEAEHVEGSDLVGICRLFISDTVINILDVAGLQSLTAPDYFQVYCENVKVLDLKEVPDNNYAGARGAGFGACLLNVSDCEMLLANNKEFNRLRAGSRITNTVFYNDIDPITGTITPLLLRDIETAYASDTLVQDCEFRILSDNPAYVAPSNSYLISDPTPKIGSGYVKQIIRCKFDPRIDYSINANRNGKWILQDNVYGGQTAAIFTTGGSTYQCEVEVQSGDFSNVIGGFLSYSGTADTVIRLSGDHYGTPASNLVRRSGSDASVTLTNTRRLVSFSVPPLEGFRGDRVVNNAPAYVSEWVCVTSSATAATWRADCWITNRAVTVSRPTLTASDIGVTYLDTTLAADGKPIWWTGSVWVDATGATV
jgi:hypothetical protein